VGIKITDMSEVILKNESYKIVGICMEIHRELGLGFKEVIYKDALELEFVQNDIPYKREQIFDIYYKGQLLRHSYSADFIVFDSIILEVKSTSMLVTGFLKKTINYLKATGLQLGIIANFEERSFISKRVVF
jgi:GxxExxY protein